MASRTSRQTNLPETDEIEEQNNNNVLKQMMRRRSFDITSNKNYSNNKHKTGYISEPNHNNNNYIPENNIFSSSEMSDFNNICNNKIVLTDNFIETKHKTENKNNDSKIIQNINYIGIGHDTQLQTDSEILAINSNSNILCNNSIGLTISSFKKLLISQPKRLHLTFHGEYDNNQNISIVKFDSIPILPMLLTNNATFLYKNRTQKYYKDYICAIARIFEQELIKFVSQPLNNITSSYTCINSEGIFEKVPKLEKLLKNIAEKRFKCGFTNYRNRKFMAIWYGIWQQDITNNNTSMIQQPNKWLLNEYKLSNICRNRQINAIVRLIEKQYKRIAENNPNLINKMNINYQMYDWSIMNHAINQCIPNEVWQFLNSDESNIDINNNNITNNELYNYFSTSYELKISPITPESNNILKEKMTISEEKILEQKIYAIMEEILKNIRQDEEVSNGFEFSQLLPAPYLNYKIFRFSNATAISFVKTKIISKIRRKYRNKFNISFNKLSSSSIASQSLCGYIPLHEEKKIILDLENGTDEISQIIGETLINKKKCNIKLLLLLGCHSYKLAQIFQPYIENIICVHPHTEIDDNICVKFSKYFYNQLSEINNNKMKFKYIIMKAFNNAMNKLHKSYKINTPCQFHNNKNINNSKPMSTLMVVRIDKDKHFELMQYVNHRLMDEKNNFCTTIDDDQKYEPNVSQPMSYIKRQSSRGGQNMPEHVEYTQICDTNNNRKSMSIDSNSVSLKQCYDDRLDEFEDSAMVEDIESCEYGIEWEYIETTNNLNFSFSIIKCNNEKIKIKVEKILKDKKNQEMIAINRKFTNSKNIYPNKSTFLTETEDDVNYVNLRWDITDLPKCNCKMNIPHRVEDELILLINGKHIDRNLKLEINNIKPNHKRSSSLPNNNNINKLKLIDYKSNLLDVKILDFKTNELIDNTSFDSNDTETEYSYSGN